MRNLMRLASARGERGVIGVLFGALVGGAVLLGMAAMVVDVGSIYAERAQLQNGADAGALAVAKGCAEGTADCSDSTASDGTAGRYANRNAKDAASAVDLVCGSDTEGVLEACPSSTGAMTDCPDAPTDGVNYVDVHTSTRTSDGGTLLPSSFAHVLAGNADYDGTTVGACARAAWGAPESGEGLALTISWCEWDEATAGGDDYAPPPPEAADASYERVLHFHQNASENPDDSESCTAEPSGADIPGGFGWTDPEEDSCTTDFNYDDENSTTYDADPGNTASDDPDCVAALEKAWTERTPVMIPVYEETPEGGGNNGQYTLHEPAAFVVTGYYLGGQVKKTVWLPGSPLYGQYPCGGSDRCLSGYFTTATTSGDPGSSPGSGVTAARLTG